MLGLEHAALTRASANEMDRQPGRGGGFKMDAGHFEPRQLELYGKGFNEIKLQLMMVRSID